MADIVPTPAAEMTKKELTLIRNKAFDSERRIKSAAGNIREAWWELAEQLYHFHQRGYWSYLGYESLDDFLAQPDLGIGRSTFFDMTKLWRQLVEDNKIAVPRLKQLEPSKVREVAPSIIRGEVKPEDALDDVEALSYRDIHEKYSPSKRAQHGQKPDDSTPLDASAEPVRVQCEVCGSWYVPGDLDGQTA